MAAEKRTASGKSKLIHDLNTGNFSPLYIITGPETYEKELYLSKLKKAVVDPTFAEFNLVELEGKTLTPEQLTEAIDSYPAMAEKKLIIVTDFDLYKPPAGFAELLPNILSDIPAYVCLVFYYDLLEGKPDKRTKLYKTLEKSACFADFQRLEEPELIAWIERQARALHCSIDPANCQYMIFLCGNSMTNLCSELEKAASHSTTGEIKKYNIDAVCSPVLDAVVFDLTDAITAGQFEKAVQLTDELIAMKNSEVMIMSAITRHIQRIYAAKLCAQNRGGDGLLRELIGSNSTFFIRKIQNAARRVSLPWIRMAASICAQTDSSLKGSNVDKQKQIELALLRMAAQRGEGRA